MVNGNYDARSMVVAIHHEDRREGSLISEKDFIRFADVHATMKNNKGRRFVVRISKTASTMEIQAIHNLRNLGYLVEAQFRARTPSLPLVLVTLPERLPTEAANSFFGMTHPRQHAEPQRRRNP